MRHSYILVSIQFLVIDDGSFRKNYKVIEPLSRTIYWRSLNEYLKLGFEYVNLLSHIQLPDKLKWFSTYILIYLS